MLRILAAASATLLSVASAQECTNVDEFTVRRRFSPPYGLADAGSARLPGRVPNLRHRQLLLS